MWPDSTGRKLKPLTSHTTRLIPKRAQPNPWTHLRDGCEVARTLSPIRRGCVSDGPQCVGATTHQQTRARWPTHTLLNVVGREHQRISCKGIDARRVRGATKTPWLGAQVVGEQQQHVEWW